MPGLPQVRHSSRLPYPFHIVGLHMYMNIIVRCCCSVVCQREFVWVECLWESTPLMKIQLSNLNTSPSMCLDKKSRASQVVSVFALIGCCVFDHLGRP